MNPSFWLKYWDCGARLWKSGEAENILSALFGTQAGRALFALGKLGGPSREALPDALIARFANVHLMASGVRLRGLSDIAKAALEEFDTLRLEHRAANPRELLRHRLSANEKNLIRKSFIDAGERVWRAPARFEGPGEITFEGETIASATVKHTLLTGDRGARVAYTCSVVLDGNSFAGLSPLGCLGIAGATEWTLSGSAEETERAIRGAEIAWTREQQDLTALLNDF